MPARRKGKLVRGFTLLELMIVITIILILLSIGTASYQQSVIHAKEATLRQDLAVMRTAIHNFTVDKQAAPQSLEELVSAGYLRDVPIDPFTQRRDWDPIYEETLLTPEQTSTGLSDVRSRSERTSPFDGSAYNTW
jgi:general secretion pathway protein G